MFYTLIPTDRRAGEYSSDPSQQPVPFCVDILDQGDSYRMEAELPGFRKEDISLDVKEGILTITATHNDAQEKKDDKTYVRRERRYGSFSRAFDISGIEESAISAQYDSGILTLTLPKQQPAQPVRRQIAIE